MIPTVEGRSTLW